MSHYFDDILQRSLDSGVPHSTRMPRVRRSSTARSIGARSDFDNSVNGGDDDEDEDARSMAGSAIFNGNGRPAEKKEADTHMHRYISDQLSRYKTENGHSADNGEEFETTA